MAWKDELDNAKKVFQNGTPKEKLEYIWDYYKWHLIIIIFVVAMFADIIYTNVTAKDYVLQGIFLNSTGGEEAGTLLEQEFLTYSPTDTTKEDIFFDTSYYFTVDADSSMAVNSYETLQVMTARIAAGEIDFMAGDIASMNNQAYNQYYYELSELLTEEQMEVYEPYFLYYDRALMEEISNTEVTLEETEPIVYPDPTKPELMEDPVPILIDVSGCEKLKGVYPYVENGYAIAFVVNGSHSAKALEFLEYLM